MRGGDRELMEEQRGYSIDSQGKAPVFVLEMTSPTTGMAGYERWGIPRRGACGRPAGGRGVVPIEMEAQGDGRFRGYSEALGLFMCWEDGRLRFFDPVTESYLRSHDEERAERLVAQSRANIAENRAERGE